MSLANILAKHTKDFHKVVSFDPLKDKLLLMDFTRHNKEITDAVIADTISFEKYINEKLQTHHAKFGVGGYKEDRILYKRSSLFNTAESPKASPIGGGLEGAGAGRSIHLGIDIWGPAGTNVYAPLGGMIHSFAFNNQFGDYGATIVLQHQLQSRQFHTLYGHLSLADLEGLQEGQYVSRGQIIGHFGETNENGDWPPHLHFQIIDDMRLREGDYPGVSTKAEKEFYLNNCPDADLVLDVMRFAEK